MLNRLSLIYDIARIVNPAKCVVLQCGEDGMVHEAASCYGFWGKQTRCRHCSSSCAMAAAHNMEKDEVREGRICHILSAPVDVEQADGSVYSCVMEMVSSNVRSEEMRVMRDRELIQLLVAKMGDVRRGVVCFNIEDECVYANPEVFQLFQVPQGELALLKEFFRTWVDDSRMEESGDIALLSDAEWKQECNLGKRTRLCDVGYHKLFDGEGRFSGYFYEIYDDSMPLRTGLPLEEESFLDPLTELMPRERFFQTVGEVLRCAVHPEYVLIASNIKDFKFVNSLFGKEKGDEILMLLGGLYRELAGSKGVAGRLHGDKFVLFMPRDAFQPNEIMERVTEITTRFDNSSFKLCVHLGVYEIVDVSLPVSLMCDRANLAIETIQNVRVNQIAVYKDTLLKKALHDSEILSSFASALENHEFEVYLQPQIARDSTLCGAEALVRWNHPTRGLLMPGQFIPLLENAGLIYQLDAYMWGAAASLISAWKNTPMAELPLSVNISARDTFYIDIYQTITTYVEKLGIDPAKLHLEITETALMSDRVQYNTLIDKFRERGFVVEIDDFGSGYSSLAMLKDIHADILKLDLGFLMPSKEDERGALILKSVIDMAKTLGMITITEGVEHEEQVKLLTKLGTDAFQGFYFDRPMPVQNFVEKYYGAGCIERNA